MAEEVWKDVVGFEGLYKVSNKGRVLGVRKMLSSSSNGTQKYNTNNHHQWA